MRLICGWLFTRFTNKAVREKNQLLEMSEEEEELY